MPEGCNDDGSGGADGEALSRGAGRLGEVRLGDNGVRSVDSHSWSVSLVITGVTSKSLSHNRREPWIDWTVNGWPFTLCSSARRFSSRIRALVKDFHDTPVACDSLAEAPSNQLSPVDDPLAA